MKFSKILKLTGAIALPIAAGGLGSIFTSQSVQTWYATLNRPPLSPPNYVFGPVWTTLFVMMGVASWLVWEKATDSSTRRWSLMAYLTQLALNVGWSAVFFGLHRPDLASAEIVILWLAIAATIVVFRKTSRMAAWLLVPYLAWVSFATYLTFAYWHLNQ